MTRRTSASLVLLAFLGAAVLVAWTWPDRPFGDFRREAAPAAEALGRLDLAGFFANAPAYGGSLLLRAPFAVAADLTGAGRSGLFVWLLLPALAALAWLGVTAGAALAPRGRLLAVATLALVVGNPLARTAVGFGHGEELLVGVMCVAGLLAALGDRPVLAGVLVGLAAGAKPWAVIAGPVLLWAARDRQAAVRACATAALAGRALVLPFLLAAPGTVRSAGAIATSGGDIAQPWSVWYGLEYGRAASLPAAWVQRVTHPLALLCALALPALLALRPDRRRSDALLVLALALLVRCLLDTWTREYYVLPAVMALVAHEAVVRRRAPVLAAGVTGAVAVAADVPMHTPQSWGIFVGVLGLVLLLGLRELRRAPSAPQPATPAIASTASA